MSAKSELGRGGPTGSSGEGNDLEGFRRRGCVGGWVRGSDYTRMPACRHSSIAPCSLYALSIVQHAQQRSSFLIVRLLYTMLIELHHHCRPRPRAGGCGWPSAPGVSLSTPLREDAGRGKKMRFKVGRPAGSSRHEWLHLDSLFLFLPLGRRRGCQPPL